jgi:hypothetical protein
MKNSQMMSAAIPVPPAEALEDCSEARMIICLTHDEIKEITKKTYYSAQQRVLRAMGIESRRRPDRSVFVDRRHYEAWANGTLGKKGKTEEKTQPKWAA